MKQRVITTAVALSLGFLWVCEDLLAAETSPTETHTIRWVFGHYPPKFFLATANKFKAIVEKETDGKVRVEVQLKPAHGIEEDGDIASYRRNRDVLRSVLSGSFTMSHVYLHYLAEMVPQFYALQLPYLLKDHQHVTRVVEGEIGQDLLNRLSAFGLEGLGFTYSGGFMNVATVDRELHRFEDFQGLSYRSVDSPVNAAVMKALKVRPSDPFMEKDGKPLSLWGQFREGIINGGDIVSVDADAIFLNIGGSSAQIFNKTHHGIVMTGLVMNQRFFNNLPKPYQSVVRKAAVIAARLERDYYIEEGKRVEAQIAKVGYQVVVMSPKERKRFEDAMGPVYDELAPLVGADLIEKIRSATSRTTARFP